MYARGVQSIVHYIFYNIKNDYPCLSDRVKEMPTTGAQNLNL